MLHGQTGDGANRGEINLKKLKNKNIDYLALGHVHKPQGGRIDGRGVYAYCGCPEGRGFDEIGVRGFILLDVENGAVTPTFVPFSERVIEECDADVSGSKDAYSAYIKVKNAVKFNRRNLYRVNLTGEVDSDVDRLSADVGKMLSDCCYFVSVKDRTVKKIDVSAYEKDLSVKGEFVRMVCADKTLDESDRISIINSGLRALDGREIDL